MIFIRRIIVYGKTIKKSQCKLEDILNRIPYNEVKTVKKGRNDMEVILKNGDIYTVASGNESAKGFKWNYAYIDREISMDIFNNIILPSGHLLNGNYEYY